MGILLLFFLFVYFVLLFFMFKHKTYFYEIQVDKMSTILHPLGSENLKVSLDGGGTG